MAPKNMCWTLFAVTVLVTLVCAEKNLLSTENLKLAAIYKTSPFFCLTKLAEHVTNFEVLPGFGWDNLQNVEMSPVLDMNYAYCKTTADRKYLIPDGFSAVSLKESNLQISAEVFEDMSSYISLTSRSINTHVSAGVNALFFKASASFSSEYQSAKKVKMEQSGKSSTVRTQARYLRYKVLTQPDMKLNPNFKRRLLQIAKHCQLDDLKMADYLSQLVIRDFGTHVITSVDAGAALVKEDEVTTSSSSQDTSETSDFKTQASISFSALFVVKVKASEQSDSSSSQETKEKYSSKITHSTIKTFGGSYFKPGNFSFHDWFSSLDDNLVTLDRSGEPIFTMVTRESLPEVPKTTLVDVQHSLQKAFNIYHKRNLVAGCTYMGSSNFNAKANLDDDTCDREPEPATTFGGVYQKCSMQLQNNGNLCDGSHSLKNPLTGKQTCPDGFLSVPILTFDVSSTRHDHICNKFLWWHYHCHDEYHTSQATVSAYWCAAKSREGLGYKFGGGFSNDRTNPFTGKYSCPDKFLTLKMGTEANPIYICASDDSEANDLGLSFGGIFSCHYGNPLADEIRFNDDPSSLPQSCKPSLSQHMIAVEDDCEIQYCSSFTNIDGINQSLPVLKRPPYILPPVQKVGRDARILVSDEGVWLKNEAAYAKMANITMDSQLPEKLVIYQHARSNIENAVKTENATDSMVVSTFSRMTSMVKTFLQEPVNMSISALGIGPSSTALPRSSLVEGPDGGPSHGDGELPTVAVVILSSGCTLACIMLATMAVGKIKRRRENCQI